MRVGRSNRIAVYTAGTDLFAATALDRVVQSQYYGTRRCKGGEQETEQNQTSVSRNPYRTVQHTVIILKVTIRAQTEDPYGAGDSSFPGSQNCPQEQELRTLPCAGFAKQWREC